jgi:hypothetical protein
VIGREVDLPVVDRTGLNGMYEVSMPIPGLKFRAILMAARRAPTFSSPSKSWDSDWKRQSTHRTVVIDRVEKETTGN